MADMEQKTEEYGSTQFKLIRIKSSIGGNVKFFGSVMLVLRHYREDDTQMMIVKIVPVSSQTSITTNLSNIEASGKLSINKMSATVNNKSDAIDLGPAQGVLMDENIRGKGVGTFAFNEIVRWLRNEFPEYALNPFDFAINESEGESDKERRRDFLEHFGFNITYNDTAQSGGTIKIKKAGLLREHFNTEKIDEMDIEKYIFGLISEKYKLERDYGELKRNYDSRGEEMLNGIPKSDIIKYTLIGCCVAVVLLILLLM